jgi:LmbE family N-acetylglucosaminyl deacetylase
MPEINPDLAFPGTIAIVAPHMDDEALACGGMIARIASKGRIHLIYATDGMKSPAPIFPAIDRISPDLGEIRIQESIAAMRSLGVPLENLRFLRLPEAQLNENNPVHKEALIGAVREIKPDYIFIPFRYDRHPDHLAVNHILTEGYLHGLPTGQIIEYFVYHRWRLLPKRDIRKYIHPERLYQVDIKAYSKPKREALSRYTSQTTCFYAWQTRPILTPVLLDEESANPEYFLFYQPDAPGAAVFTSLIPWIRIAHRLEPRLVKWKYLGGAYLKRVFRKNANPSR